MNVEAADKFLKILGLYNLTPAPVSPSLRKYGLTRQQLQLIYLVGIANDADASLPGKPINKLSWFANTLGISRSTLTRNVEKLEARKVLMRVAADEAGSPKARAKFGLKLLSLGQLYLIEIENQFVNQLANINI